MASSVESLKAFMAAGGRSAGYTPVPGVICVGAGKGGVGTSLIAALMAVEAARRGERVLLVDADETIGSLHMMLGVSDPGPGVGALRGGAFEPGELLRPAGTGLTLLPGGGGGVDATLSAATGEHRALLRRVWSLFPMYSTVVIDGGSRLASVVSACTAGVERLVCVTAPDRISLAASYALFKVVRARFETLPVELIVNGADDHGGRSLHAVVRAATQTFLGTDVQLGGTVPEDAILRRDLEDGRNVASMIGAGGAISAAGSIVQRILSERLSSGSIDAIIVPALPI